MDYGIIWSFIQGNKELIGWAVAVIIGIVLTFLILLTLRRKKQKEPITERIRWSREGLRELDGLLEDLEKYFQKIEKKLNMEHILKE